MSDELISPDSLDLLEIDVMYKRITNAVATAVALPARYLYSSYREYIRLNLPQTHKKILFYSKDENFAVVRVKDVPPGVGRSCSSLSYSMTQSWAEFHDKYGEADWVYDGPSEIYRNHYCVVRTSDICKPEQDERDRARHMEMYYVDGITRDECLAIFIRNQREPAKRVTLTPNQLTVARHDWAGKLATKRTEAYLRENAKQITITCESQYDIDE